MRLYFDNRGRRGVSTGVGGLAAGFWIYLIFLPLLAVVWYFPLAVARTTWPPAVKLLVVAAVWGAFFVIGSTLPSN